MRTLLTLAVVLFATVALGAEKGRLVPRVDGVTAKRNGRKMVINATGTVPTLGWKNPRLVQVNKRGTTVTYEFRADPPTGMAAQMIAGITATLTTKASVSPMPDTVVVVAGSNRLTVKVAQ